MKLLITASKSSRSYIDTSTTGVSYYDDFLNDKGLKYLRSNKNRDGKIVMMSPDEYYHECAYKIFDSSVNRLVSQRRHDKDTLEWMYDQISSGKKLKLPYINYADNGQEGLHRMMALGDILGWDTKFPVLIVAVNDDKLETSNEIYERLRQAVREATTYQYSRNNLIEEFKCQIEFEIDKYMLSDSNTFEVSVESYDDKLVVAASGYEEYTSIDVWLYELRIKDESEDDEIDDEYIESLINDPNFDILDHFNL